MYVNRTPLVNQLLKQCTVAMGQEFVNIMQSKGLVIRRKVFLSRRLPLISFRATQTKELQVCHTLIQTCRLTWCTEPLSLKVGRTWGQCLLKCSSKLCHIQRPIFGTFRWNLFFIPINIYIECLAKNLPIITIRRTIKMQAKINLS